MSDPRSRSFTAALALALAWGAWAGVATAQQKPPAGASRPQPPPQSSSQQQKPPQNAGRQQKKPASSEEDPRLQRALERAERHLLAYATADARRALEPFVDRRPADPAVQTAFARVLLQEGAYEEAVERLEQAIAGDRRNPEPYLYLGEAYQRLERPGPARQAFTQAKNRAARLSEAEPQNARAFYWLGAAQLALGEHDAALASFEQARALDPSDPLPSFYAGTAYSAQQRWQQAVAQLDQALAQNPAIALAYFFRGMAYGRLQRKAEMVRDLDRFLAMAPQAPEAEVARSILATVR